MNQINILVVDDHPVVREGLVAILSTQPDLLVVGEAENGSSGLELIDSTSPDILLLDLEMPGGGGLEVLKQLKGLHPETKVIVFSAYATEEHVVSAVQAGVKGYLLKGTARAELFEAVRVVYAGGSMLQPMVVSRLVEHLSRQETESQNFNPLTTREQEVMQQLARGKQNKEIALTLSISERTVKYHVSSILRKLGASNRTEAATIAAQQGMI